MLIVEHSDGPRIPRLCSLMDVIPASSFHHSLGYFSDFPAYAVSIPENTEPPRGCSFAGLRSLLQLLSEEAASLAGRSCQLVHWDATHRFCGRCGTPTRPAEGETAKECPRCGLLSFPRISPAIIVAVVQGSRILLVQTHRHTGGVYSNVAGFVEPGETLEEAVERELDEEVGIRVRDIRYHASQPWPFPHSLMVGFSAEYAGGDLRICEKEIVDARWFDADDLPPIPGPHTIARRLIDLVLKHDSSGCTGRSPRDQSV